MTLDLDAIKARCEAATRGPWSVDKKRSTVTYSVEDSWGTQTWEATNRHYRNGDPLTDAEFVAHAREDVPALVAEVERLRAEVGRLCQRVLTLGNALPEPELLEEAAEFYGLADEDGCDLRDAAARIREVQWHAPRSEGKR